MERFCKRTNKTLLILGLAFFLSLPSGPALGEAPKDGPWHVLETKYTIIRYQSRHDLKKFYKSVDYSPGTWGLRGLFSSPRGDNLDSDVKKKVDALTERVQEILDMRRRMQKVVINVYPDHKRLEKAYRKIYKGPCNIRAWYIYEHNAIFITVDDVHEGILAHEMAHAIIDHYLIVRPPRATAEILARYVDEHLFD